MGSPVTNSVSNDRKLLRRLLDSLREQDLHEYRHREISHPNNRAHHAAAYQALQEEQATLAASVPHPQLRSAPLMGPTSPAATTAATAIATAIAAIKKLAPLPLPSAPPRSPSHRIYGRAARQTWRRDHHPLSLHQRGAGRIYLADAPARGRVRKPGMKLFRGKLKRERIGEEGLVVDLTGEEEGEVEVKREDGEEKGKGKESERGERGFSVFFDDDIWA